MVTLAMAEQHNLGRQGDNPVDLGAFLKTRFDETTKALEDITESVVGTGTISESFIHWEHTHSD